MATAESENSEWEIDLSNVKRMTQEVNSYGFEDCVTPLVTWRIERDEIRRAIREEIILKSPQFPTIDDRHMARLTLVHVLCGTQGNLSLIVRKSKKQVPVEPFPLFLCKIYDGAVTPSQPKIYLPQNAFDCRPVVHPLLFELPASTKTLLNVFEIHQVSWKWTGSSSPFEEVAWGKIERFREEAKRVGNNEVFIMSPLFTFDPAKKEPRKWYMTKRYMMVRFWYPESEANGPISEITVTLHLLNHVLTWGRKLFKVVVTIFKQKEGDDQEVMDLVVEIKCRPEVEDSQPYMVLIKDMTNYVDEEDTLYYKIRASLVTSETE